MKAAPGHSSTDEVITWVLGKKKEIALQEKIIFLLTKEITGAEHCFTILSISKKSYLNIFFQSLAKVRKVGVERIVSFYFKVNSTECNSFHFISSLSLLKKYFLLLIICGIFSTVNTSNADGRKAQGSWLRIWRQWAVKNDAKSRVWTTVFIFLLCIKTYFLMRTFSLLLPMK